jgi:hypothetical protein
MTILEPMDALRSVDEALGVVIDRLFGAPRLDVAWQERRSPPHPTWVSPPLSAGDVLLVRATRYRLRDTTLSRNLAFVDLARLDPDLTGRLEAGTLHLGEVFATQEIEKSGFVFGTREDAEPDMIALLADVGEPGTMEPFVWRRYVAAVGGRRSVVVAEALPVRTWDRLLRPTGRLA